MRGEPIGAFAFLQTPLLLMDRTAVQWHNQSYSCPNEVISHGSMTLHPGLGTIATFWQLSSWNEQVHANRGGNVRHSTSRRNVRNGSYRNVPGRSRGLNRKTWVSMKDSTNNSMPDPGNLPEWCKNTMRASLLSTREFQVFLELGGGSSNRTISTKLKITERTVKAHVARIMEKLSVESRLQAGLISYAYRTSAYLRVGADLCPLCGSLDSRQTG
ncbi:LuxR C-terminal-related transcriptional regulator [Nocardia sp. NPDC004604]|uniref:response regulator transcription factor n=1 Tax=Nocardia sp. NPDC004604 TaxID=3157013 RepID=UPI0033A4AD7F